MVTGGITVYIVKNVFIFFGLGNLFLFRLLLIIVFPFIFILLLLAGFFLLFIMAHLHNCLAFLIITFFLFLDPLVTEDAGAAE